MNKLESTKESTSTSSDCGKPVVSGSCENLLTLCKERNLHCSITYQKINDLSIEIYRGYVSNYEKLFYTDGHIELEEPLLEAIAFVSNFR